MLSLAIGSALVFAFVLISGDSNQPTSVLEAGLATLTSLLAFLVGLSVSIVVYRLGPWHPLADYPGPVLAKLSKLWMGYCIVDGKRHLKLQEWVSLRSSSGNVSLYLADYTKNMGHGFELVMGPSSSIFNYLNSALQVRMNYL